MTNSRYVAMALAMTALITAGAVQAQNVQNLKQTVQQDLAKLRHDTAAEHTAAAKAGLPETRRQEVMATARELKKRMDGKRAQLQVLEKQAESEKDPAKRRELEKQIGGLHHSLAGMQTEYGDALLYNKMPNLNNFPQ